MSKALNIQPSGINASAHISKSKKKVSFFSKLKNNLLAKRQAKRIMKALDEAEQIHAGRQSSITLSQAIKEL